MFNLMNNNGKTLHSVYRPNPGMEFWPFNTMSCAPISETDSIYVNSCILSKKKTGKNRSLTLNHLSGIAKAIERVLYIDVGAKLTGGYAYDNQKTYAEYWRGEAKHVHGIDNLDPLQTEERILFCLDQNGVTATHVTCDPAKNIATAKPLTIAVSKIGGKPQGVSASSLFFMMLVTLLNPDYASTSKEAQTIRVHYQILKDEFDSKRWMTDDTALNMNMRLLENDLYAISNYECDPEIQDLLDKLSYSVFRMVNNPSISPKAEENMHGDIRTPSLINGNGGNLSASAGHKTVKKVSDYVNEKTYFINEGRILTEEESALVPRLDDTVPPEDVVTKVKLIKASTNSPKPFRNILWIGETGTGKSTAARIAAQLMHLPYTFITINPDTIVSDLYVNVLPAANKTNVGNDAIKIIERAVFDTDGAWFELTGEHKEDVQPSDVIRKVLESCQCGDFMYVESPLVKAFRYGWVCELQEVNYAMKPGVLGGINAALDDIGIIELPTGEVVKRHPDTVIIMTANDGYEGTRKINQAVKSRMTLKGHMELPDSDTLARRAMQNSGYRDMRNIKMMIAVMEGIRKILEENGETNGSCSVRELQSWCQATEILGDPYEAALSTIVPSATDDPEITQEVIEALETQFTKRI